MLTAFQHTSGSVLSFVHLMTFDVSGTLHRSSRFGEAAQVSQEAPIKQIRIRLIDMETKGMHCLDLSQSDLYASSA